VAAGREFQAAGPHTAPTVIHGSPFLQWAAFRSPPCIHPRRDGQAEWV